ncbi:hypothetical protein CV632_13205 [Geobacillus thermodenitrificans]|nr:hypothetical protein GD3902_09315 [Geobacillus thermodenitrificans]PJW20001.1 hypothetical protein CV632_13205 [Geobacillus thermodenitrificans]
MISKRSRIRDSFHLSMKMACAFSEKKGGRDIAQPPHRLVLGWGRDDIMPRQTPASGLESGDMVSRQHLYLSRDIQKYLIDNRVSLRQRTPCLSCL